MAYVYRGFLTILEMVSSIVVSDLNATDRNLLDPSTSGMLHLELRFWYQASGTFHCSPSIAVAQHQFALGASLLGLAILCNWNKNTVAAPNIAAVSSSGEKFCTNRAIQLFDGSSGIGCEVMACTFCPSELECAKDIFFFLSIPHS